MTDTEAPAPGPLMPTPLLHNHTVELYDAKDFGFKRPLAIVGIVAPDHVSASLAAIHLVRRKTVSFDRSVLVGKVTASAPVHAFWKLEILS